MNTLKYKGVLGSFNVRLTPDLHNRITFLAKQTGVSINAFIRAAVEKHATTML